MKRIIGVVSFAAGLFIAVPTIAQSLDPITVELTLICSDPSPECRSVPTLNSEYLLLEDTPELTLEDIESASIQIENVLEGFDEIKAQMGGQAGRASNLKPQLNLHLTENGKQILAEMTEANLGQRLAIVVDGKVLTASPIRERIAGGTLKVLSDISEDEVKEIVSRINEQIQRRGQVPPILHL